MLPDGWRLEGPVRSNEPWRAARRDAVTDARVTVEASTMERLSDTIARIEERAPQGQGWVPRPGPLSTGFVP